jgi:outer membrane immunogenic protein
MTSRFMLAAIAASALAVSAPAFAQNTDAQDNTPWHGWYAGINLGGDWGHGSQHLSAAPANGAVVIPPADIANIDTTVFKSNPAGFTGGIEGGYNYKYKSSGLLLGAETDFDYMNVDQKVSKTFQSALSVNPPPATPPTVTIGQRLKTNWIWTLRPRIGWVFGDRWLLYATGGLAVGDIKQEVSYVDTLVPSHAANFSKSDTHVGWTAGVGAGYALSPNWSMKVEWLYADLGTISGAATTPNGYAVIGSSGKLQSNMVRVGVDYRF